VIAPPPFPSPAPLPVLALDGADLLVTVGGREHRVRLDSDHGRLYFAPWLDQPRASEAVLDALEDADEAGTLQPAIDALVAADSCWARMERAA
jgi:hypothetical protein